MDLICYRASAKCEQDDSPANTLSVMEEMVDNILTKTNSTEYRAFLTGEDSFRKKIYPEYKANRKDVPKPKWLHQARDYAVMYLNAEEAIDGLEADDYLAIYQTDDTIICSLDKDLLQVEGRHFQWEISGPNWSKPDTFITQVEIEGKRCFYTQTLTGDSSDNVKGVPNIGIKKATKLLQDCTTELEMFNVVREQYGNDEEFLMNARCLYLLRSFEDDYSLHYERLKNGSTSDQKDNS